MVVNRLFRKVAHVATCFALVVFGMQAFSSSAAAQERRVALPGHVLAALAQAKSAVSVMPLAKVTGIATEPVSLTVIRT